MRVLKRKVRKSYVMNKTFQLLIAIIFLFPLVLKAQAPTVKKDTVIHLSAGDIEDDFASSFEKGQKKIIILDQKDVLVPKSYEKKEKRFFFEPEPLMQNDNFAIIDLPEEYTGYKIEVLSVKDQPLPDDDIIFFRHGNVVEEMLDENTFAYSIGDFETQEAANDFMELFLLELYPDARVIPYIKGQRN
ncbi:MAG: hypothetical protein DWQ02_28395 [Bacteroidetes bacterium]|nr:MAG: hypothetical protein DWQ02_28395 [Bacteroidota bacterium]